LKLLGHQLSMLATNRSERIALGGMARFCG